MNTTHENALLNELDVKLKEYLKNAPFYKIGLYTLDIKQRILTFKDEQIPLTRKEMYVIVYFAANLNKLVLRSDLLKSVWKEDTYFNGRSMDVYLCKIRKLLSKDPDIYIVNVHGKGFRIVAD